MDAIKFISEHKRMCASYTKCIDCPLFKDNTIICTGIPSRYSQEYMAKLIKGVEEWSATHPFTTRQDIFKKVYPSAPTDQFGVIFVCPRHVGEILGCADSHNCRDCCKKYWLKEAQNGR